MDREQPTGRFGTFGGVFTPCVLTILGVIMFLRFGQVVGQAGIANALLIVLAAKLITTLTSLSLSAIATNTRVQGGGAYFLISRSLGVEFGGAIGLVFFLAQAISVAMYVIGFSEAFVATLPTGGLSMTWIATFVNILVFVCVYIGAGWTIRVQYFILAILGLALISFYIGAISAFDLHRFQENIGPQYRAGENFFSMFALFFPAVTGIMAGANMSGDLRDPAKSIPWGTLAAVAVTGLVYLSQAFLMGCAQPRESLIDNNLVISEISRWPVLITAGVFAATLSSALGSMMGAPRILQAFAKDNVVTLLHPFSAGSGISNEPRRAVIVTFLIAQICILLADLNTIAPLITMAFMITYGLVNLATFYEAITKNPSYRPRFRYCHWSTSLLGALGCLAVMLLIDYRWAVISIALMYIIHRAISRREITARWGDVNRGLIFERARINLLKLEAELHHPKNWRPIILALSGAGWDRPQLAVYGHWFESGHGILSLGQVIMGEVENRLERLRNQQKMLDDFIREQEIEAFPVVVVAPYLSDGIEMLVQSHGLGAIRPNTVLLGWPTDMKRAESFAATLRSVANLDRSIVAMRIGDPGDDPWDPPAGTLDIWWRGLQNGELMLLLAHLLTQNDGWRGRTIRLMRVIENEAGHSEVERHLISLIEHARIQAVPQIIVDDDPVSALHRASRNAALVFIGFEVPAVGDEGPFFERMQTLAGDLPRIVFVDSSGGMSLDS